MLFAALVALAATPTSPDLACEATIGTGTVCTEVRLAKGEDPKTFSDSCTAGKNLVKSHCEREGSIAKCSMGDTTLIYSSTSKTSAGEAAGLIRGGQNACASHGGLFESKVKITAVHQTPKTLALPDNGLSLTALSDCTASEKHISCGNSLRPEVTLDVSSYTGDEVEPQNPDDVLKQLKELTPNSTLKELGRKTGKTWRVEYAIAPKHGVTALGFEAVRQIGAKLVLCVGSAWTKADHEAAKAMCDSLKVAK